MALEARAPLLRSIGNTSSSYFRQLQCRASKDSEIGSQSRVDPFSYGSSDGRRKASLEDALSRGPNSRNRSVLMDQQPWNVGWQMSERHLKWHDQAAAGLVKRVAAQQLQCSEQELDRQFADLTSLLPGINERMATIKADCLAKLVENPARVAERLTQLKAIFPRANVQQMVLRDFNLLLAESADGIARAAEELREFLPSSVQIDRLCQEHPSMLATKSFKEAVKEVQRLMPKLNIAEALNQNPEIIFSTQRHEDMIPYDAVPKV